MGCQEASASLVSIKPSMWMPPVMNRGSSAATAPRSSGPKLSASQTASQPHSARPMTAPTNGKKHMLYRRFSSVHSTWGTGMRE